MDSIVLIPARIVEWLSAQSDMNDLTFFTEFPPIKKAVPLTKAIIAVGIENIEINDKFVENDDGVLEKQEYCRLAMIKARLSICVPFEQAGQACHDIFTRIVNALTFRTNLNIVESGCEAIESDHNTDALVMNGWFMMEADFCPAESTDESFVSFLDKELLCGSHIRNENIHLTAEEKEKVNTPFITGFYFGNGSTSRKIELDFTPKFVFAAATSLSTVSVNFTGSSFNTYFGMANENHGTQGLDISTKGFTIGIKGNASLNSVGVTYIYLAFK